MAVQVLKMHFCSLECVLNAANQWHGKRDLSFILYADGAKKAQQREIMAAFDAMPLTGLKKEDIENL